MTCLGTRDSDTLGERAPGQAWPGKDLERVGACPVCGAVTRHLLYENLTDNVFFCAPGRWTLYECIDCGSAYLDPRPTPSSIHLAYSRYYTHVRPKQAPHGNAFSALARLRLALGNGYSNWRFGSQLRPASRLGLLAAWLLPIYKEKIDRAHRYIPKAMKNGKLLDIGAGNAAFMIKARDIGWDVAGAEPDSTAFEAADREGLHVRKGGVECFADEPNSFDVITINHVIEHVHTPRQVLEQIFRLLKPGGSMYLETPNVDSFGRHHFGRHWRGLEPPRHLMLFSWNSLESLLTEVGFEHIKRHPITSIFQHITSRSRAIQNGQDPYQKRKQRPFFRDRIAGALLNIWIPIFNKNSEFITLTAYKPEKQI